MLVGVARRTINPELGHHLAGYGPDYPNTGVHDDLAVTTLYLNDGGNQAILMSFDLIGLTRTFNQRIRAAVAEAAGLTADQIFLTATHTHSGPEVRDRFWAVAPLRTLQANYNDRLVTWAAEAAAEASRDPVECDVHYNFAPAAENMNRRYQFPDRRSLYIPNNKQLAGLSDEFVDRELGIVAFRIKDTPNRYRAVLTNYSAHPLCVGNSSNLCSADYQGYIRKTVEETFGGCLCITTTGAAGNQHPLMPESGFEMAREMGTRLGMLTINRTYDSVRADDQSLRTGWREISLRLRDQKSSDLMPLAKDRAWLPQSRRDGVDAMETSVYCLGIGPILLAGMPGELVGELGAMLRWSSPFLRSYTLFQATDNVGYIPARNHYMWGNYEVSNTALAAGEGERLVAAALDEAAALLSERPLRLEPVG